MQPILAVGLMSGTSLDGIDAALVETDGAAHVRPLAFFGHSYDDATRTMLAEAIMAALALPAPDPGHTLLAAAARHLTELHIEAVDALLAGAGVPRAAIGVIGFHGQTVAHRPERGWTWQIGEGQRMADALGVPVVADLRGADVKAGGHGAPLLPVYHRALAATLPGPIAVLNLGGVANLTWIGAGEEELIAFDTGPANGLIDDWVREETGARYDAGGALAAAGRVDQAVLGAMLANPWFCQPPPKSLDRSDFSIAAARGLGAADGAATLARFTAETVAMGLALLPAPPTRLIVAGGGRHNATLMRMIDEATGLAPEPIEALGWNGDATEAEGFAYMAVRVLQGLPISFPGTTGAPRPMTGGVVHRPG